MELPKQYTDSKGKPNILGLGLFLLSVTALSYQIYVNRLAVKKANKEESDLEERNRILTQRIEDLEELVDSFVGRSDYY
jgi:hypothetical protein